MKAIHILHCIHPPVSVDVGALSREWGLDPLKMLRLGVLIQGMGSEGKPEKWSEFAVASDI